MNTIKVLCFVFSRRQKEGWHCTYFFSRHVISRHIICLVASNSTDAPVPSSTIISNSLWAGTLAQLFCKAESTMPLAWGTSNLGGSDQ